MKYLVLLGLLIGCAESNPVSRLDKSLEELNKSTKSLEFSTFSLRCLAELQTDYLRAERERLNLPKTRDAAMILIDAKIYECVKNRYNELSN